MYCCSISLSYTTIHCEAPSSLEPKKLYVIVVLVYQYMAKVFVRLLSSSHERKAVYYSTIVL